VKGPAEAAATWPAALALLVRAEGEAQEEWAAQTALQIVRDLAGRDPRCVLVEADRRAGLARLLRVRARPGIAEVLRGELSVPQVAVRPEGETFYFVPPGHGGWGRSARAAWQALAERVREGGGRWIVYATEADWPAPEGIPGLDGVVWLDARGDAQPRSGTRVLAHVVAPPDVRRATEIPPPRASEDATLELALEAEPGVLARRRRRARAPVAAAATGALLVAAALWAVLGPGRGESGPARAPDEATGGIPPALDPAAARPVPYSVQMESYSALPDAVRRARDLAGALRAPTFVAPGAVDTILYYRVFVGLASEPDSARALLRRVVERGFKDSSAASDVRHLAYAFDLGIFPDRGAAERRQRELLELGIPTYLVDVPTTVGTRVRLYAGGYESAEDAQTLGATLSRNGIAAPLVERVGAGGERP
jgi:hypothetical protein